MKFFLFLYIVLVTSTVFAELTPAQYDQVNALVEKYHNKRVFHGNFVILEDGESVYSQSVGYANLEFEIAHNMQSKFMIAFLSKQFTAYAILDLQKKGKLQVTDLVSQHINLPEDHQLTEQTLSRWNSATIHDLLTHTSGLRRDILSVDDFNISAFHVPEEIFESQFKKDKILSYMLFESMPGEKFNYSNLGYFLLSHIIQRKGASFYKNYLRYNLFSPLNMKSSGNFHRRVLIKKMSSGYFYDEDENLSKRCCIDSSMFLGSHSLYSSMEDLITWVNQLFYKADKLDSDNVNLLLKSHLTEQQVSSNEGQQYSYGFFKDNYKGVDRIWHNGLASGFVSLISYLPESKRTIILLSNRHGAPGGHHFDFELHNELTLLLSK